VFRSRSIVSISIAALAVTVVVSTAPARAVGGEGESWPSFNESDGCGSPWSIGPNTETMGHLGPGTVLRGPQAAYFGRTIDQVAESLVPWAVPMSDGEVLQVHRRTLPALQKVAASLVRATSRGWTYDILSRQTFGYTSRTVRGRYRVSQHGFGNAVDINSWSNPSTEGPLVTDMPGWFVKAWSDAGFCWGGNWVEKSDAMHFSWRGPAFTVSTTRLLDTYPPLTAPQAFSRLIHRQDVPIAADSVRFELLMDADGDSVIDVVTVTDRGATTLIEVLSARSGYALCDVIRYRAPITVPGNTAVPGDWDHDGIPDLWIIDDDSGVTVTTFLQADEFTSSESVTVETGGGDEYVSGDFDVDGWGDLYILSRVDTGWVYEIRSGADRFSTVLAQGSFAGDPGTTFTLVDRNLDQVPDLVAVSSDSITIFNGVSGIPLDHLKMRGGVGMSDIAGSDFDGDGRHDIVVLQDDELMVLAGNTPLEAVDPTSWFLSPDVSCGESRNRISGN
jgi:hypothetical protein